MDWRNTMRALHEDKTTSLDGSDESAEWGIAAASRTVLSPHDYDVFCEMLERPLPRATLGLLESKTVWE